MTLQLKLLGIKTVNEDICGEKMIQHRGENYNGSPSWTKENQSNAIGSARLGHSQSSSACVQVPEGFELVEQYKTVAT